MNVFPVDKFDWQRLIRETEGIPQVTKLVALVLSTYANKDGTSCHPGAERLAREVGLSERRLRDHLGVLRDDLRLVYRTDHGGGRGRRLADVYQLCVPENLPTLLEDFAKHRTSKRPPYRAETPDVQASDVSTETPDVKSNTPDVGEQTPDVESTNTGRPDVRPPVTYTSHIDHQSWSSCGESIAAPAAPSPDDNDVEFESARSALAALAPVVMEKLLDDAMQEIGAQDMRAVVIRAADMRAPRTAVAS